MPIAPIVPRRLYRQVAEQLRRLFDDGEYKAGDRLPAERNLAEQMGVSRPTVREALIALEVEGRVQIRVGSGIYVTGTPRSVLPELHDEGPFEVLAAREFIESAVAAEAARRATPEHVAALDDNLRRMERSAHPSATTLALDREFHALVAAMLGNDVLVRVVGELFDQRMTPYFSRLTSYFEDGSTWADAQAEHRVVRDAIAAGDAEAARKAMQVHLKRSQRRFTRSFDARTGDRKAPRPEEKMVGATG